MALLQSGLGLLFLVATAAGNMVCKSAYTDVKWLVDNEADLDIEIEPFASMSGPYADCCDNTKSHDVDLQEACHLCYNLTKSTPGFAADVNNCAKFYKCEPNGKGGFTTFHMDCPVCSFWDQNLLTCVQVWFDSDICTQTHVTDNVTYSTPVEDPLMFCIDFEDNDLVANDQGYYRPYVFNDGVTVVKSADCPQGEKCGYFNESLIELPVFSNNYGHWPSLRIELEYKMIGQNPLQGIVSNDCFPDGTGTNAAGNSLFISLTPGQFNGGLKAPAVNVNTAAHQINTWGHAAMNWVGQTLVVNDGAPGVPSAFKGPIRESHCPLVIGAFIKEREGTYFNGYMDNICFYKW